MMKSLCVHVMKQHLALAYTAGRNKLNLVSTVSRSNTSVHASAKRRQCDRHHLHGFVCSAVIGRVRQCEKSAKYGCSVTAACIITEYILLLLI